ncbi:hypothetical protein GA0115252_11361, partial [Streptomyces sp. DfronAA-171]
MPSVSGAGIVYPRTSCCPASKSCPKCRIASGPGTKPARACGRAKTTVSRSSATSTWIATTSGRGNCARRASAPAPATSASSRRHSANHVALSTSGSSAAAESAVATVAARVTRPRPLMTPAPCRPAAGPVPAARHARSARRARARGAPGDREAEGTRPGSPRARMHAPEVLAARGAFPVRATAPVRAAAPVRPRALRPAARRVSRVKRARLAPQLGERGAARDAQYGPARLAQGPRALLRSRFRLLGVRGTAPPWAVEEEGDRARAPAARPREQRGLLRVERADEGDEQPLRTAVQGVVGRREAGARRVVDDREDVEERARGLGGLVARGREAVAARDGVERALVGDEAYVHLAFEEVREHRGGSRDGPLEGAVRAAARVGRAPRVEQHRAARPARLLLAPHHQLPVPRRRAPVDPAQVVAVPVAARDDVVLAGERERALPPAARAGGLPAEPRRGQRDDGREHGEGVARAEGTAQLAHPEGVAEPQLQGTEREAPPHVGTHPVRDLAAPGRLDAVSTSA